MSDDPKILFLDIETRPHVAEVWGLWDQNIAPCQVREWGGMMSVGAKWFNKREVFHFSQWQHGHQGMLDGIYALWEQADAISGYNNNRFDNRKIKGEFARAGMTPPPKVASIDLIQTVKREFNFDCNKLDQICEFFGVGKKLVHEGHPLWSKVMAGDPKAQAKMERYCKQDVRLTERLYKRLRPWITNHPYIATGEKARCPNCGGDHYESRGWDYTAAFRFKRRRCLTPKCGRWYRGERERLAA